MSLFASAPPLAEVLRPEKLEDVVGQAHLFRRGAPLEVLSRTGRIGSVILHGPPGVGKTTIARLIAARTGDHLTELSATSAGAKELRTLVDEARTRRHSGKRSTLFLDEIHRWSTSQQDLLLPHIESGLIGLIGATTENPSYAMNSAVLSRVGQILKLELLDDGDLETLLQRAEAQLGRPLPLTPEARRSLRAGAGGDARALLVRAEQLDRAELTEALNEDGLADVIQARPASGDTGDGYDLLSAFHKSMRASDETAALYYAARLLKAGTDPRVIMRRLAAIASEDVGLANPDAMVQVQAAWNLVEKLGMPEARIPMSQAIIYVALSSKSNRAYLAVNAALELAGQTMHLPPPLPLQVAATALQRREGRGQDYAYDHDFQGGFSGQQRLPDALVGTQFYQPGDQGWEARIIPRLNQWRTLREAGLQPRRTEDQQDRQTQTQEG